MEVGAETPSFSKNVGIGLEGAQTNACTCSKWQLTYSNVPHTPVTGTCGPIRSSGLGMILRANFYIKIFLFYLINSPIVYFTYSFLKVNHIHPKRGKNWKMNISPWKYWFFATFAWIFPTGRTFLPKFALFFPIGRRNKDCSPDLWIIVWKIGISPRIYG